MSFLKELQSKSPAVKGQIAFWSATVFVGVATIIWATTLPVRLGDNILAETPDEQSPFEELFSGVRTQVGAIGDTFNNLTPEQEDSSLPTHSESAGQMEEPVPTFNFDTSAAQKQEARVILIATSSAKSIVE